jgi:enoyl-CoA hydratase/carnithine racemase
MKDKEYHEVVSEKFIASWQDLTKVQKPIIAAVNGFAVNNPLYFGLTCSLEGAVNWR